MLNIQELRNMTIKEISEELAKAKKLWNQAKIQISTKHTKNTHISKDHKSYLAQLFTVLSERRAETRPANAVESVPETSESKTSKSKQKIKK